MNTDQKQGIQNLLKHSSQNKTMNRGLIFTLIGIILSSQVLAQTNMMGSSNGIMGGSWMWSMFFLGFIYLAIGSFIFSLIFWLTYKSFIEEKNKIKR